MGQRDWARPIHPGRQGFTLKQAQEQATRQALLPAPDSCLYLPVKWRGAAGRQRALGGRDGVTMPVWLRRLVRRSSRGQSRLRASVSPSWWQCWGHWNVTPPACAMHMPRPPTKCLIQAAAEHRPQPPFCKTENRLRDARTVVAAEGRNPGRAPERRPGLKEAGKLQSPTVGTHAVLRQPAEQLSPASRCCQDQGLAPPAALRSGRSPVNSQLLLPGLQPPPGLPLLGAGWREVLQRPGWAGGTGSGPLPPRRGTEPVGG